MALTLESDNMRKNQLNVAIIDYGIGNLFSVKRACDKVGINAFITSDLWRNLFSFRRT